MRVGRESLKYWDVLLWPAAPGRQGISQPECETILAKSGAQCAKQIMNSASASDGAFGGHQQLAVVLRGLRRSSFLAKESTCSLPTADDSPVPQLCFRQLGFSGRFCLGVVREISLRTEAVVDDDAAVDHRDFRLRTQGHRSSAEFFLAASVSEAIFPARVLTPV